MLQRFATSSCKLLLPASGRTRPPPAAGIGRGTTPSPYGNTHSPFPGNSRLHHFREPEPRRAMSLPSDLWPNARSDAHGPPADRRRRATKARGVRACPQSAPPHIVDPTWSPNGADSCDRPTTRLVCPDSPARARPSLRTAPLRLRVRSKTSIASNDQAPLSACGSHVGVLRWGVFNLCTPPEGGHFRPRVIGGERCRCLSGG
jgi:hypothetical protein